ncbi:MAG: Fur family transcriptional regulator [Thermoguttaceae bacterium]|nr:Fur family transcriptional regulator [Thermoguttaceae bacterium]
MVVRLQALEERCRQRGVPVTVQRRAILEAVLRRKDHPSADDIFEAVHARLPQVSRTTIYRVLDTFVDMGLIRRLRQTGAARFDRNIDRHHHLICTRCGKVMDLEDPALDQLPMPKHKLHGFEIDDYSVQFSGTCPDCQRHKE